MLVERGIRWYLTSEVVILGYGGAGAVAGITAHDQGADVVILEKQPRDGHYTNTGMSLGVFLSPTDPERAARHMEELYQAGDEFSWTDTDVIRAWSQYACRNKTWVEETLKVPLLEFGNTAGTPFDGQESMIAYVTRGYGYGLFRALHQQVEHRNIKVLYDCQARNLLTNVRGEVIGVRVEQHRGDKVRKLNIGASKAVIMTCGGFQYNETMKLNYLKVYPFYGHGTTANTGDGVTMAQEVGADLWHMNCCTGRMMAKFPDFPIAFSLNFRGEGQPLRKAQTDLPVRAGAGFIVVDQHGQRYTNENGRPHYVHYEMGLYDSQALRQFRIPSYWIFDQKRIEAGPLVHTEFGAAGPYKLYQWSRHNSQEIEKGWIVRGDSLSELGRKLGVDPGNLDKTLRNYNNYCESGEDPEFSRIPSSLIPLENPPYYGVRLYPGGPTTHGGPRRNAQAQILSLDGEPIRGLYGAGELGSIYGMLCIAGGGFLAECLAFGRIAGEYAAQEKSLKM